jgi:murein DD-endopeptidase MepM/ murein hydrolase activator NlpD
MKLMAWLTNKRLPSTFLNRKAEGNFKTILTISFATILFSQMGCNPVPAPIYLDATTTPSAASPLPSPSTTLEPTSTETPVPRQTQIFSPLAGIPLSDLPGIISNPFQPPRPGVDDGHHGTDFSFLNHSAFGNIDQYPIHSVLSGKVAAAIQDSPPYGNFVIIETALDQLPQFINIDAFPAPAIIATPASRLTCPEMTLAPSVDRSSLSLYVLYAHMANAPDLSRGAAVQSGKIIGQVGNSGYSSNAHLHLEMRIGPSNATFNAMAHMANNVTLTEMSNYCLWRISGFFQLIDPMTILISQPN